jgi:predicted ATPase
MQRSLTDIYDAQVAEGRVNPDAGQRAVLPMLEALRQRLEAPPPKKGLLSGLFARAEPEGPMGLYLWGGVGRGKSMLMDLFAEAWGSRTSAGCISTPSCRKSTPACTRPASAVSRTRWSPWRGA